MGRGRAAFATPAKSGPNPPLYPDPSEDSEECHNAFLHAYEASRPREYQHIPGLQEFAAAIFERNRRIPSSSYSSPLDHIFTEFDEDNDGKLSVSDVTAALMSRNVQITNDQVMMFIDGVNKHHNHMVERHEFADLVFSMASLDVHNAELQNVHSSSELMEMRTMPDASAPTRQY